MRLDKLWNFLFVLGFIEEFSYTRYLCTKDGFAFAKREFPGVVKEYSAFVTDEDDLWDIVL